MEDLIKEKSKTKDILMEIDNLKKYTNQLSNNVRSEKLENYITTMNNSISNLQDETENYYNENYNKEVEESK